MVFCAVALGCAGALNMSFPKSIWFLALCSHSGPKYLYLAMKTSYLHVYLVPTRLLIFRKKSHLHVYLVYTFIQYQTVCKKIQNIFIDTIKSVQCVRLQPFWCRRNLLVQGETFDASGAFSVQAEPSQLFAIFSSKGYLLSWSWKSSFHSSDWDRSK